MRKQAQEDFKRSKFLADVALSPDGRFVAFVSWWLENEQDQERSALFLLPLDRQGQTAPRNLTADRMQVKSPVWAPDSQRILFLSDDNEEQQQVWLINLAGGEARKLTTLPSGVNEVAWSPDGHWLALTALAAPQIRGFEEEMRSGRLSVSPAEENQAFEQFTQLFMMAAPGTSGEERDLQLRRLTNGGVDYTQPSWTPDSQEIGVLCNPAEDRERSFLTDLWTLAPATGEARCLTDHTLEIDCYTWSPDGRSAILVASPAQSSGSVHLYLVTRNGNVGDNILLLTPEIDTVALSQTLNNPGTPGPYRPVWSQDGQKVYFLVTEQQAVNVYALEVVWRTLNRLTKRSITSFLTLFPEQQSLLLAQQYSGQNWELYRLPLDATVSSEIEQLTRFPE